MTFTEARAVVKKFVSDRWGDQKLAEVLAFVEDGKMDYGNGCCCLVGVDSSDNLHTDTQDANHKPHHYTKTKWTFPMLESNVVVAEAELGYRCLSQNFSQRERDQKFIEILKEVMEERAATCSPTVQTTTVEEVAA